MCRQMYRQVFLLDCSTFVPFHVFAICCIVLTSPAAMAADVNFQRDVRPILAKHCYACHGPDDQQRKADLRLDQRSGAVDSGAIVPGDPGASELVRRIQSEDLDQRMPPPDSHPAISPADQQVLIDWIASGGDYQAHWAFSRPTLPAIPSVDTDWPHNPIDHFVWQRMQSQGQRPTKEADRYTLVRRLYLDLVGFVPTPEQADAFVNDDAELAYEKLVDQLLQSEHYGERWARRWLDLARYSDTNGYEKDRARSIWPYRDWVIRAINEGMPFDQFSIKQLAGDMLPHATDADRVATGFHRNTMLNEEGGIDPLEYRYYAMVDRVATTGTIWLGLTVGCAQCHTHKYDPITHSEYYQLMALLNNADEPDLVLRPESVERHRNAILSQIAELESQLCQQFPVPIPNEPTSVTNARLNPDGSTRGSEAASREAASLAFNHEFTRWFDVARKKAVTWTILRPQHMQTNLPKLQILDDGSILSTGDITKRDVFTLEFNLLELTDAITAIRLEVLPDERLPAGGPGRAFYEGRKGDFFLSELRMTSSGHELATRSPSVSYGKISIGSGSADANNVFDHDGSTGWSTAEREGESHQLVVNLAEPIGPGSSLNVEMTFERHFAASLGRFRFAAASNNLAHRELVPADASKSDVAEPTCPDIVAQDVPPEIATLLEREHEDYSDLELASLRLHFARTTPLLSEARKPIEALRRSLPEFPTTMVMSERSADNPRTTTRHHRGDYLTPREEVEPGLPEFLSPSADPVPRNRLEFAQWLVSERNPMAARVAVNRDWQAFFGRGIVETLDDFGTQGGLPTHPELLDWLSCEFQRDWSQKHLHRLIVTSATYRQDSNAATEQWIRDPDNQRLARGPRFRLDAETIRDTLLQGSGLLNRKMFGPSVFPPQPESVTAIAYGGNMWTPTQGADRFRRSLYTFSKRTAPFAAYHVFDAPTGESCTAGRTRSNTPLQALTLLNDSMYVEMATFAAMRLLLALPDSSPTQRARSLWRQYATRPPTEMEIEAIVAYYRQQQGRLDAGELQADQILMHTAFFGDKALPAESMPAERTPVEGGDVAAPFADATRREQAAWTLVARVIMNLDQVITKP